MKRIFQLTIVCFIGSLLACSAKQLNPAAQKVRITTKEPSEKRCEYLGEVMGEQGDWLTGQWTSNKNLEEGSRNDMKNKAAEMGGNVVQLLTKTEGNKGSFSRYGGSSYKSDAQYVGLVYRCAKSK